MQKPEKNNVKKDIRVKYLTDHFSLTVGNLYMYLLPHIAGNIMALFVYDVFFLAFGVFFFYFYLGIYDIWVRVVSF